MKLTDIPIGMLREAPWNPNQMDDATMARLKASIERYNVVQNLVVRPLQDNTYEVLSGNQRLQPLRDAGLETAPCVVVELDDARARLLAQALNHIHGEDDLGLRAELVRSVLADMSQAEVLAVLPETAESLKALASLGHDTIANHLQNWQQAQSARLKHLQFHLTAEQLELVERALAGHMPQARRVGGGNPNARGIALYLLCKNFLGSEGKT